MLYSDAQTKFWIENWKRVNYKVAINSEIVLRVFYIGISLQ